MEKEKILTIYERKQPQKVFEEVKSIIVPIVKKVVGNSFEIEDETQLMLGSLTSKGYIEEKDGKVYPTTKFDIRVCEKDGQKYRNLYIVLTPFNCYYFGYRTEFSQEGKILPSVNLAYREYMKESCGVEYSKIMRKFKRDVKTIEGLSI